MDGGLTFLPQPWVPGVGEASAVEAGLGSSINVGGEKTTAVLDMEAVDETPLDVLATAAPAGMRTAPTFVFLATLRRMGANARLADHPKGHQVA